MTKIIYLSKKFKNDSGETMKTLIIYVEIRVLLFLLVTVKKSSEKKNLFRT